MREFEDDYRRAIGKSGVRGLGDPQVKKELEDRVYRLHEALRVSEDENSRHEIQFLLDRAKGEYQKYILAERKMVAMIRRDMRVQAEEERKKKRQLFILIASIAGLALVVLFVILHINAANRAAKNEAAAKAAFQQKSDVAKDAKEEADNKLGDTELFPKNLIGTWSGQQGGAEITLTFSEDGTVTVTTELSDGSYTENSGVVTSTLPVDDTTFRIVEYSGVVSPEQSNGTAVSELGYKLGSGGKELYPILWQSQAGQAIDYSKYTYDDSNVLKKED
ncbi:hypothetical protein ACVR1G_10650 [Streptococcus dentasini]